MKINAVNSITGPTNLFVDLKRRLEAGQSVTLNLQSWRKARITIAGFHSKSDEENLEDWAKWAGHNFKLNRENDTVIIAPRDAPELSKYYNYMGMDPGAPNSDHSCTAFFEVIGDSFRVLSSSVDAFNASFDRSKRVVFSSVETLRRLHTILSTPMRVPSRKQRLRQRELVRRQWRNYYFKFKPPTTEMMEELKGLKHNRSV